MTESSPPNSLRVLIVDESQERLRHVTDAIESLGHTVIAEATDSGTAGVLASDDQPDVAIVCLDESALS